MQARIPPVFVAAIGLGVVIRIALLTLPPPFTTDVSYYNGQAVGYLLRGIDPYGAAYSVPVSLATQGASNVFAYFPGVFAYLLPLAALGPTGGLVLSDFVVAGCLLLVSRARGATYSSTYLLLPPTILFSAWFPNDALPAIAFLSVALLLQARGRTLWAAPLWGLAAASGQEALLVIPIYAYYSLSRRRYADILVMTAAASAVLIPFYLWNPSTFAYDTVFFQFSRQAVPVVSAGPFGLNVNLSLQGLLASAGITIPLYGRASLGLLALILVLRGAERDLPSLLLRSAYFTTAALFLLAGELFWSYLELPLVLLLFWAALRGDERRQADTNPSILKEGT